MKGVDDSTLVAAAVTGDGSAYGELFALYEKRIYNYAYGILGNAEDAADVAQDAFVRVFQALPGKDASLNFSAYIYRTTHNLAMDAIKHRSRFTAPTALDLEHEPSLQADPEKVALLAQQQEQAWRATSQLSESHRAVLALRELHDMSYQEIADVMEMPRATVGVTLSRARLKFKEAFRMSSVDIDKLAEECQRMLPLLSAYIDDELDAAKRTEVSSHVEECAFCQLALEEMAEASKSYRAILPLLPPTGIAKGVHAGLTDLLSPEEAYAMEQSFGGASTDTPGGPDPAASRPRTSRARWIARTVIVIVCTFVLALAGTATISEFVPPEDDIEQQASLPSKTASTDTDEPTTQSLPPEEPENEAESADESGETPLEPDDPAGTFAPTDPAATPAHDNTPPPTPAQTGPESGVVHDANSAVTLAWGAVDDPSGVTYSVDLQRYDVKTGDYVAWKTVPGIAQPTLTYQSGETAERWRVWATDGEENPSAKSGWWTIGKPVHIIPGWEIYEPPTLY